MLKKGKINILLDLTWGSSAKGQIVSAIAYRYRPSILMGNSAPSASHTYKYGDDEFVFKILPTACGLVRTLNKRGIPYRPTVVLSPSSGIDIEQLKKEMEWCGLSRANVIVHHRAFVVEDHHGEVENAKMNGGVLMKSGESHLGSTSSGQSAAYYDKISRDKTYLWAGDREELQNFVTIVDYPEYIKLLSRALDNGATALAEMPQGFPLSIDYSTEVKKSTFRNINPLQFMSDIGLNISYMGNVIGNIRSLPIRVSNRFLDNDHRNVKAMVKFPDGKVMEAYLYELGMTYSDINAIVYDCVVKGDEVTPYGFDFTILGITDGVVGNSGAFEDDMTEISWRKLADDLGLPLHDLEEKTTLTKLPRRIAVPNNGYFSESLLKKADITIKPDYLSLTFLNYLGFDGVDDPEFLKFIVEFNKKLHESIRQELNVSIVQFGADVEDVYFL